MAKTAGPTRQQIETDIRKKQFAPIYLLMGEESFYIDRIADMILKNALTEEEKDFNLTTYYGADATMADVVPPLPDDGRTPSGVSQRGAGCQDRASAQMGPTSAVRIEANAHHCACGVPQRRFAESGGSDESHSAERRCGV